MSNADIRKSTTRSAVQARDSKSWGETLAAAQRVIGYYASRAERSSWPRGGGGAAASLRSDLGPASRLTS